MAYTDVINRTITALTKSVSKNKTDIHIYLDASGSENKNQWIDMLTAVKELASSLHIKLYLTPFTHQLYETKLVECDEDLDSHVTGGTDIELVFEHILENENCQNETSIVITDFWFLVPKMDNYNFPNLYYANTKLISNEADDAAECFCKDMESVCPEIRERVFYGQ